MSRLPLLLLAACTIDQKLEPRPTDSGACSPVAESCDGDDNDCDDLIDEGLSGVWYQDLDQDGYGDDSTEYESCSPGSGDVAQGGDCDDSQASVSPSSAEICDTIDNNCDGQADEDLPLGVWYEDKDGDGWGDPEAPLVDCAQPEGSTEQLSDCDDLDSGRVYCSSCEEILARGWSTGDGDYTLETTSCGAHTVWCDMSTDGGGWTEVVRLSFDTDDCPGDWQKTSVGFGLGAVCWRNAGSSGELMRSASFSTCGVVYEEVLGDAVMYQYGTTDAFGDAAPQDVNTTYGDVVSLTLDGSARTHLFSYVFGLRPGGTDDSNCPDIGGASPPAFVGSDYLCATGNPSSTSWPVKWYETPLFVGQSFQRTLADSTTSDIEVRLIATHANYDEDVAVESIRLMVR